MSFGGSWGVFVFGRQFLRLCRGRVKKLKPGSSSYKTPQFFGITDIHFTRYVFLQLRLHQASRRGNHHENHNVTLILMELCSPGPPFRPVHDNERSRAQS